MRASSHETIFIRSLCAQRITQQKTYFIRGLWATRIPLEACGACVFPDMFSLASAHEAFQENGQLKDAALHQRLKDNIKAFMLYVKNLTS